MQYLANTKSTSMSKADNTLSAAELPI